MPRSAYMSFQEATLGMRAAPAPITDGEIWKLPEGEQLGSRQVDVLLHALQYRAHERIRLAEDQVEQARGELKKARKQLRRERTLLTPFLLGADYDLASVHEVLREKFPERFNE